MVKATAVPLLDLNAQEDGFRKGLQDHLLGLLHRVGRDFQLGRVVRVGDREEEGHGVRCLIIFTVAF